MNYLFVLNMQSKKSSEKVFAPDSDFIIIFERKNVKMIEDELGIISQIKCKVRFSIPPNFTRCFKEEYGLPPNDALEQHGRA